LNVFWGSPEGQRSRLPDVKNLKRLPYIWLAY